MNRRTCLLALAGPIAAAPWRAVAAAGDDEPLTLGLAWRGPQEGSAQHVGAVRVDWARRTASIVFAQPIPTRAHGLLAETDGMLLAVAARPGRWLLRCDAQGRPVQRLSLDDEPQRSLDGHVIASTDGRWLYTTETDRRSGRGLLGVRDRRTLRKLDEWPTHGVDPHQLLLDDEGAVMVANGGVPRDEADRKRALDTMDPSLVRLDARTGALLGQWRLPDPRLSLRHIAWGETQDGRRLLGIALQAEHDDPARRAEAPLLALWDGASLALPMRAAAAGGYAGDIAAGPDGFVVSAQRAQRALRWRAAPPHALSPVAQLREVCAVATTGDAGAGAGVVMAAASGIGRWHPAREPLLVAWPEAMAVDNHCVVLRA